MKKPVFNLDHWLDEHVPDVDAIGIAGNEATVDGVPFSQIPQASEAVAELFARAVEARDENDIDEGNRPEDNSPGDGAAFVRFLRRFDGDDSALGDLALDVRRDRDWPATADNLLVLVRHMLWAGAHPNALAVLRAAWGAFRWSTEGVKRRAA